MALQLAPLCSWREAQRREIYSGGDLCVVCKAAGLLTEAEQGTCQPGTLLGCPHQATQPASATNIEDPALAFKRLVVSWMLIFVIVSAKVVKKHSLVSCSMAWVDHSQIFFSYKYVVKELCHKGIGERFRSQSGKQTYRLDKFLISALLSRLFKVILGILQVIVCRNCY